MNPEPERGRTGATAVGPPRRRRPLRAWLLAVLIAIVIVIAVLLLASRCGSGSPTAGAPVGTPAPGTAAPGATAPGVAPGGTPPGGPSPGAQPPPAPGTPRAGDGSGAAGDAAGLRTRIDQIVATAPVTFLPDLDELTPAGAASLERVGRELAAAPDARVTLTGYAAPAGMDTTPDPQHLSDRRAATVAHRLAGAGIEPARVQTRGASDSDPRPDLAASRRVEFAVG